MVASAHRSQGRPRTAGPRGAGSRGTLLGMALRGAGVLVIAAALVAVDRLWIERNRVDPAGTAEPAVRVAGAVRSISGPDSVRRARYDPGTQSVRVEVSSRYYDAAKPVAENREYLATEGRLAVQLALFDNTTVQSVTILLYSQRQLLATVTGRQGDAFGQMPVAYSGPLSGP